MKVLIDGGRMSPHGLEVYENRNKTRTNLYSFEQKTCALAPAQERTFKANRDAWEFFNAQPPGYRKLTTWWVVSAKKEETKERRLATLIATSAAGTKRSTSWERPIRARGLRLQGAEGQPVPLSPSRFVSEEA